MTFNLKIILANKKVKQVGTLYTSMLLGIIVGVGTSVVNTRLLGPQHYGDLKFLQTFFAFVVTFITFGLFFTGSRLLAQDEEDVNKNKIIGNLLLLSGAISLLFSLIVFIFSFFEDAVFGNNLGNVLRIFCPLLLMYPYQLCIENILLGRNYIYQLSAFRIVPAVFYLISSLIFNYFYSFSLNACLSIYFIVNIIFIIIFIVFLKPKLGNSKEIIRQLHKENKRYGFHVYTGSIIGVSSAHLSGLCIAYFIDNIALGIFSLALTITSPLTMIPNTVGSVLYKDFANSDSINRKATLLTLGLSISVLLVFILLIEKIVLYLYTPDYMGAVSLSYMISVGCILHGFGDFYNKFLGSHGKGQELRNGAILVGIINILGYPVFVSAFGVTGAAAIKLLSGLAYFTTMYLYYKKYQNNMV